MTTVEASLRCLNHNCFDSYDTLWERRLSNFHNRIVCTFRSLPSKHKLREIIERCIRVVIAPLAYVVLFLGVIKERLLAPRVPAGVYTELDRLRQAGILTSVLEKRLDEAIEGTYSDLYSNHHVVKVLLSQALEIKQAYGKEHYIFSHAQGIHWYVVSQLIKVLVQITEPEKQINYFEFLRSTKRHAEKDARKYRIEITSNSIPGADHNKEVRTSLISCDAYLLSNTGAESALSFLKRNCSILNYANQRVVHSICREILTDYLSPKISAEKIENCAQQIFKLADTIRADCGNLFVICIPKIVCEGGIENIGYFAHPFGTGCFCHPPEQHIKILDQLQALELNHNTACASGGSPQFRLMPSMVTPDIGAHSFLLNPLPSVERHRIIQTIHEYVSILFQS